MPQYAEAGGQDYEEIAIGEHMFGQALQTYQYLRKKVESGELKLYEKARKPSSFGHLKNQTAEPS